MRYTVKITPHAVVQIQETIAYISKVLMVPETAKAWADHLEKEIGGLVLLPERNPLVDREPWKSRRIRKMTVKNFLVYYFVDKEKNTVWVTAVIYARRDQLNALKEIPLGDDE